MSSVKAIWTIGHSTLPAAAFIELLTVNRIELVADVRRFPASRRHPQFNREALMQALEQSGIAYLHFPELGGRREPVPGSVNTGWRESGFRGYADHMDSREFEAGMVHLREAAAGKRTGLMCAEKDWRGCHRGLVSDYLKVRGVEVLHILESGKTEAHPYTKPARIVEGQLSYAAVAPFQSQLDL